jgi:hypothetical protein
MPNRLLEAALQYADRGWHVFPCKPRGKTPLVKGGFKSATTDPAQIEKWWRKWPDANVAVATGHVSGIVVLDMDGASGIATLRALIAKNDTLPKTAICTTGRGFHIYFNNPYTDEAPICCSSGNGLDIRGDGGYVIAPPSVHESGAVYAWREF